MEVASPKVAVIALAVWSLLAPCEPAPAQAQDADWLIAPHLAVGMVAVRRPIAFGGYGVTVAWRDAPQLSYQRTGFGVRCKGPICTLDASSARQLMAGWSLPVYRQEAATLRLRPEAGIGWWRSNDESDRTIGHVFGAVAETAVRVGPAGALLIGLQARHSSLATTLGAAIGLGIRF